jgi:hypothetical protein
MPAIPHCITRFPNPFLVNNLSILIGCQWALFVAKIGNKNTFYLKEDASGLASALKNHWYPESLDHLQNIAQLMGDQWDLFTQIFN